ncbi:hypothetical protein FS842_004642 [Serendipita sp. 407]|nr:hypothetical protein FS842_004642 [Serendipita sp. 407]
MSDLIKVAKQVKKGALEAINRLKFSHSDEELDLRSRLLSLYREANFTVDTLTATSNDATPRSQPSHIDSLILEKTLHDALSVLKNKSSDTNSLRLSWLGLTSANKDLCRQLWNTRWILPEAEAYQGPSLLIPFALKPFRVVVGDISDIQLQTPISHIFDSSITHHMRSIIQLLLQSNYTTEARLKGRRSLQDRLLLSLWCDTARALQLWEAELSRACLADHKEVEISSIEQIRATIDQFDQGLRDLLVRNRNDKLSIAVIGVEGSGKSSFLNYIIGRDLLLEEVGQATTYPCRIRHKPGQTTPELTIDATYLNERVVLIRARPLFQALKEAEWDPKFVASDPRFRLEVQQWLTIVQRVKGRESLTAIADPDFALNGPFVGDEAVATAVSIFSFDFSTLNEF